LVLLLISCAANAQEINVYSEFLRFNPYGEVVRQDREIRPREVLSPAVPRNGHRIRRIRCKSGFIVSISSAAAMIFARTG
jgi:hypothetical protein